MASTIAHQPVASEGSTLVPTASTIRNGDNSHFLVYVEDLGPNEVPPEIIPPVHPFRTLVLCFDGTGNQFDVDNSNILHLLSTLKKDDRTQQICYYQTGIGTYTTSQIATPLASKISKTLDEMFAWNLDAHVIDGYKFLMQNYTAGDKICLFGFSRGAYTARALAGMLHKVGLLPECNHQQIPFAYKLFKRADRFGWKQSRAFKRCLSIDVDIEFIGVWDTVQSVGLLDRRLPFITSNTAVRTFRHACALDEHRVKFKANLWNRPSRAEAELGEDPKEMTRQKKQRTTFSTFERRYEKATDTPTDIEEVWFAGCHCDVGGGSVENDTDHTLARISLRWMIRECFKTFTGIMFDANRLREIGLDPARLYPEVLPRPPPLPVGSTHRIARIPSKKAPTAQATPAPPVASPQQPVHYADGEVGIEEEEELHDLLSPSYDQLSLTKFWWILELLPLKQRYQRPEDDKWANEYWPNLGRPRSIPMQENGLKVHRSVKMRMEAEFEHKPGQKYIPLPFFGVNPTWID